MAAKVGARWERFQTNGLQKAWQKRCGEVGLVISGRKPVTFTQTLHVAFYISFLHFLLFRFYQPREPSV